MGKPGRSEPNRGVVFVSTNQMAALHYTEVRYRGTDTLPKQIPPSGRSTREIDNHFSVGSWSVFCVPLGL